MPDLRDVAIAFENVTKRYRLGGGPREQLLEALGLNWLGRRRSASEFVALDRVTFDVGRGKRMGLIGRNGAGKTTLLKLISGNYRPTEGKVVVNGSVQALMTMGQGFHPDYTGRDNIRGSLHYNGLSSAEAKDAFDDIVEFCELGPFLDEPFKTYSSGMQARLMFATATAIKPDILIVDEVLGAGDAYFIAKSKRRVERIVEGGCTLLLVSHSMGQVLELCEDVIWLEAGRIKAQGAAFDVVKAYEESLYGALPGSGDPALARRRAMSAEAALLPTPTAPAPGAPPSEAQPSRRLQVPAFCPHAEMAEIRGVPDSEARIFRHQERGGVSRWPGAGDLRVVGFSISGRDGPTDRIVSLQPALINIFLEVGRSGAFNCTYGIAISDLHGRVLTRLFSPPDHFMASPGDGRRLSVMLNPNQLGPGVYTVGVSLHEQTSLEEIDGAVRYDLLNRSFSLTVELPDSLAAVSAAFFHTSEWRFDPAQLPPLSPERVSQEQSA